MNSAAVDHVPFVSSRLLRVSSDDAEIKQSVTDFTVDLGNLGDGTDAGIRGLSVEGCGFMNVDPNIIGIQEFNTFAPGPIITTTLIGDRFYSFAEIANLLVTTDPRIVAVTLVDGKVQVEVDNTPPAITELGDGTSTEAGSAAWIKYLGFTLADATTKQGDFFIASLYPNLQGLTNAYLMSAVLAGSQNGIDSDGNPIPMLTHIPVTSEFGFAVEYTPFQDSRPSQVYGDPVVLRQMRLQFTDNTGRVIDGGSTPTWAVFRLYL